MQATKTITYNLLTPQELSSPRFQTDLITFLHHELGQYSDPPEDIRACLDYILHPQKGGCVFVARIDQELQGVVLLTKTNMELFVPPYLLVYIATRSSMRGQGIGAHLLKLVRESVKAPVALHVEHDNPAKKLYERLGFTSKYAEMRWYP